MMYKSLISLKKLKPLQSIKPLKREPLQRLETPLSAVKFILYSTNICYHTMRIVRDEITVKNRDAKLKVLKKEISKIATILDRDDHYLHSEYTKQDVKKFFKEVGIRPEHLKH